MTSVSTEERTPAQASLLRVELFGGLRILRGGQLVVTLPAGHSVTLLAILCLSRGRVFSRDELAVTVWPGVPVDMAKGNLRQCLYRLTGDLRKYSVEEILARNAGSVRLSPGVDTDVCDFLSAVNRSHALVSLPDRIAALHCALSLQQYDLLPGCFNDLILHERERLVQLRFNALRSLSACYLEAGNLHAACEAAITAWGMDPGEESACQLMRVYAAQGLFGAVRSSYSDLARCLQEDGQGPPSDETNRLLESLLHQEPPGHEQSIDGARQIPAAGSPGISGANVAFGHLSASPSLFSARAPARSGTYRLVLVQLRWVLGAVAAVAILVALLWNRGRAPGRAIRVPPPVAAANPDPEAPPAIEPLTIGMPLKGAGAGMISGQTPAAAEFARLKWNRWYDPRPGDKSNQPTCVTTDAAGNLYEVGFVDTRSRDVDFFILKYAPDGRLLWDRRYNGPGNDMDRAKSAVVDSAGCLYVTGESDGGKGDGKGNHNALDIATLKFDPAGNQLWLRRWAGPGNNEDSPVKICLDPHGNVVITGYSNYGDALNSSYDWITLKYSSKGDLLWTQRFGGPRDDRPTDMTIDRNGRIYVVGDYVYEAGGFAAVQYGPNGARLWAVGLPGITEPQCALCPSGELVICGDRDEKSDGKFLSTTLIGRNGRIRWTRKIFAGMTDQPVGRAVVVTRSGLICVAGRAMRHPPSSIAPYMLTAAYDGTGNRLWQHGVCGPAGDSVPVALKEDSAGHIWEGDYVFDGNVNGWHTGDDVLVSEYRQDGTVACRQIYNAGGDDVLRSMTLDRADDVVLAVFSEKPRLRIALANLLKLKAP